jgi:hypothetical protein
MAASPFWQVRCWMMGRTHRRSTKTHNLKRAQQFAKAFFEELVVYNTQAQAALAAQEAQDDAVDATGRMGKTKTRCFGDLAELMFTNEQSRCDRGEFSRGSVQVLRNRLDVYVLPRWGQHMPQEVDFSALLAFGEPVPGGRAQGLVVRGVCGVFGLFARVSQNQGQHHLAGRVHALRVLAHCAHGPAAARTGASAKPHRVAH